MISSVAENSNQEKVRMNLGRITVVPTIWRYGGLLTTLRCNKASAQTSSETPQKVAQLPVPTLEQTMQKYLKSVEPFLTKEEYEKTKCACEKFEKVEAVPLQKILIERAKHRENWLTEWWEDHAYLAYRDPVTVYSSPGITFPRQKFASEEERIAFTAKLILGTIGYKKKIDDNLIPQEFMGKAPLDMNQYHKLFGTCRIPGLVKDTMEFNPTSKHIIIMCNNHFFKLNVIDNGGKVCTYNQLEHHLKEVMKLACEPAPPIGALTAEYRDTWGKAYQCLLEDKNNAYNTKEIQKSLFLVCFDKPMTTNKDARTSAIEQCIHGGGTQNGVNRWFDKTIQFVIGSDGVVGITYEHAPSEGQGVAVLVDTVYNYVKDYKPDPASGACPIKMSLDHLQFTVTPALDCYLKKACENLDKLGNSLDMNVFQFSDFGKKFVQSNKLSPDSFIQTAMQYAFFRLHNVPGAHYESASLRKYIHGRTETIRSCSNESIAFAKTMLSNSSDPAQKHKYLIEAVNAHRKYTLEALNGFGVDRHLLGLKLAATENNLPVPQLYEDPSYLRSTKMRMGTSQVATKCDGVMGYAPIADNGYAICYNPRVTDINFALSSFANNSETDTAKYRKALEDSLRDMQDVLSKNPQAKL